MNTEELKNRISFYACGHGRWKVEFKTKLDTRTGTTTNSLVIDRIKNKELTDRAKCENGYTLKEAYNELKRVCR